MQPTECKSIEEWSATLDQARRQLDRARGDADDAAASFRETVCAAFAAGLTGPQISKATSFTVGRLYQIRDGRRT